jgi:predicted ATP-grasp superfamily ATP-dependent carboligase
VPLTGRWLLKSRASTGGSGVCRWRGEFEKQGGRNELYLQEYIEGESCAAVFVSNGKWAQFIGLTRQLIGETWLFAKPFRYCGSIGPLPVAGELRVQFQRLGAVIARGCGLRGIFGIDCIVCDNTIWPVEVNPRYTASVEILELALGLPLVTFHVRVFEPSRDVRSLPTPAASARIVGKAVLFARKALEFPVEGPWLDALPPHPGSFQAPLFGDIPQPLCKIRAGQPILTIFAEASSEDQCFQRLMQQATNLDWVLNKSTR